MKKSLLSFCLILVLFPFATKAQNQPTADYYWNLIKKNASKIGLFNADLQNVRISDAYYDKHADAYMVYLQQTYKGVDVDDILSPLTFKKEELATGRFVAINDIKERIKSASEKPAVTAATAFSKAAANLELGAISQNIIPFEHSTDAKHFAFVSPDIAEDKVTVDLKWTPLDENNVAFKLSWEVTIHTRDNNALWLVHVDAVNGAILNKKNLTTYENWQKRVQKHEIFVYEDNDVNNQANKNLSPLVVGAAKYNVIPFPAESPIDTGGSPTLKINPWTIVANADAYTLKWNSDGVNDYDSSFGNNVHAVEDKDHNNKGGIAAHSVSALPNVDFDYTFNPSLPSDSGSNQQFALTNLFYWNNLMHDVTYQYGFDEVSGNFQTNNLNRGGKQKDFVNADAQDGSGIDNSNFATPVDGSSPRMQMFLFTPSSSKTLHINSPVEDSGTTQASLSEISLNAQKPPLTSNIIIYNDKDSTNSHLGCGPAGNASALKNKIAYIDRGTCGFDEKVRNAQAAGAAAIIIGDNLPVDSSVLINMIYKQNRLGDIIFDDTVTIPSLFIKTGDALTIKSSINSGTPVNATIFSTLTDGDLDNGVISHEYTHGISNRLTGGPYNTSCLTNKEEMGEGWSDYVAIMMTKNWASAQITDGALPKPIGNYAIGDSVNGPGIRSYPYSTNIQIDPQTYEFLTATGGEAHLVGEIWCTMLWEMTWEIIEQAGLINPNFGDANAAGGNSIAMNLVIEGMKLQTCKPGFIDGRNAILNADTLLYGGKYSNSIWIAFAKRGLGYSASEGSSNKTDDGVAAYDLPPDILAVQFANFTAEKQGNTSLLKWTTEQEINTNKFIVERSTDGRTFASIGEVPAYGNSAAEKSYQLTDNIPAKGNNIYRVKEVDKDGKINLSDLRSLNFADLKPYIKISPNPASDVVLINIPGNNQNLNIRLLSEAGQQLKNYTMSGETLSLNVSNLSAGVYNIIIEGNGYSTKYKLVIR